MSRSRNIKPGFFKNEVLAEMPYETRLLFIGLWTLADREGRLEDRPKRIKAELFAFESLDVDSMLSQLQREQFVTRYEVDGVRYVQVENFVKHQDPHYKEKASQIPPPPGRENAIIATGVTRTQRVRILERDGYKCQACGATEHLCIDHVLPVSRGGDSSDDNLQTLCMPCNTKKGNKLDGELKNQSRKGKDQIHAPSFEVESKSSRTQSNGSAVSPLIPDSGFLIPSTTEANASAADAAPVTVPADPIWGTGLAFLIRRSIPEKQARALLGKLRQACGDVETGSLLLQAETDDISDPAPWLMAAASKRRSRAGPQSAQQPPSKTPSAIQTLQAMKHGNVDPRRDTGRPEQAHVLELGQDTGGGHDRGNRYGVG